MAETLYGYQKEVTCPQCGYKFPVNCSSEVEPKPPRPVESCTCPNCRLDIRFERGKIDPSCDTGDRVLVAKFVYDTGLFDVEPFDVVVFKFPEEPQRDYVPMNYIKRLIGKPTQTVGIYYGDLYISEGLAYDASLVDPSLPERRRIFKNAKRDLLENWDLDKGPSPFKIMRKPPDKSLAMRRIVYDNDHPAKDLQKESFPPRWSPERDEAGVSPADFVRKRQLAEQERSWVAQEPHGFRHAARQGQRAWLRYRHLLVSRGREFEALPNVRPDSVKPQLITDFMGYNSGRPEDLSPPMNWVGDLLLECKVTVEQAEGEFAMELSKGADRFQAVWQLPSGQCQLIRLQEGQPPKVLESRETALKKPGSYRVRFANVDQRLTVWVDGALPFGEGVNYEPPTERRGSAFRVAHGPSEKNDLEPASIGVQGAGLSVGELKLWRDTYYTVEDTPNHPDSIWAQPSEWDRLRDLKALTLYVQPNHYLCLGDNSPRSSDSRSWGRQSRLDDAIGGLVPERLMLGRALLIYWPFDRFGPIK